MKKQIKRHNDLIDLWENGHKGLAKDLIGDQKLTRLKEGLMYELTRNWYRRGRISCDYYLRVVAAAKAAGFDLDLEILHRTVE